MQRCTVCQTKEEQEACNAYQRETTYEAECDDFYTTGVWPEPPCQHCEPIKKAATAAVCSPTGEHRSRRPSDPVAAAAVEVWAAPIPEKGRAFAAVRSGRCWHCFDLIKDKAVCPRSICKELPMCKKCYAAYK